MDYTITRNALFVDSCACTKPLSFLVGSRYCGTSLTTLEASTVFDGDRFRTGKSTGTRQVK